MASIAELNALIQQRDQLAQQSTTLQTQFNVLSDGLAAALRTQIAGLQPTASGLTQLIQIMADEGATQAGILSQLQARGVASTGMAQIFAQVIWGR